MRITESNKDILIKFVRDQFYTFLGIVSLNVLGALDKKLIAPNFTSEGLQNLYIGFETGVNEYWALFWAVGFITVRRYMRSKKLHLNNNIPDHVLDQPL